MICTQCDHLFDPSDERAFVSEKRPDLNSCPACTIMGIRSTEAWAVYNGCQGVFTCGVGSSKADAVTRLESGDYEGAGCEVVPVRIVVEPEERRYIREWMERDRAQHSGQPQSSDDTFPMSASEGEYKNV